MRHAGSLPILIMLFVAAGCTPGPKYQTPQVVVPIDWKAPQVEAETPSVDFWWEVFNDEVLSAMEIEAIQKNPDLDVALERVVQARAQAGMAKAALFPQITLDPSYTNSAYLTQSSASDLSGTAAKNSLFRLHQINNALPLDLSYQLDLWGTYRGQHNSAVFSAEAQAEIYHAALLTLTTDLAEAYFQMRSLDAQMDLLQETIDLRKRAYEVNEVRWQAGLVNYTDVSRAALEWTNAEAKLCDARRLRAIEENRVGALMGNNASATNLPRSPLEKPPPLIPVGLPSSILLRRPDIAQAEREMAAQHALIGVAKAAFLPSISLTGSLGYASPNLHDFLSWKSRLWELGIGVSQFVFDGGFNSSNLAATWAEFRQTSGSYQSKVLTALREVEDALVSIEWRAKQAASLDKSVESAAVTTLLSTERYSKGLVNYLEVVDSERDQLQAEVAAIELLAQRYISTIQLIKAIGGGW